MSGADNNRRIQAMKQYTDKQHERHLNALYTDMLSEEQAVDNLIYLTSKNRSPRITENNIRNCHRSGTLGTLLRKLDPIAFQVSKQDR